MCPVQILISAGEASGEMYGAQLIRALRRGDTRLGDTFTPFQAGLQNKNLQFFGAGGERMRSAGCEIVVDARDLAVVGITEILSHLPKIYGLYQHLIEEADARQPALAVVIDSPAFNWRVARQMRKRGIPVVYYVCPQFWAWRQGRVKLLRKYVNKALVIFPFEEKFYRDRGVDATFVGHPLADVAPPRISRQEFAEQNGLSLDKQWITIMPGSRAKEVSMNLPTILESVDRLGADYEYLLPIAPTLSANFFRERVGQRPQIHLVPEALPALFHSRAGIIASGTATIEAALMGLPFVMVYRVSGLTYLLGRPRIKVPHFAMVNLIAGRKIVPELAQHDFTAENVVRNLQEILPSGSARSAMIEGLTMVSLALRGPATPNETAADRAAQAIQQLLPNAPLPPSRSNPS